MFSRRKFLLAAAGFLSASGCRPALRKASPRLARFVDPLPLPSIAEPLRTENGVPFYEIAMRQFDVQLHRDWKPGAAWGFGDPRRTAWTHPGPTLEVRRGQTIRVHWRNQLPSKHLLPVDRTVNMTPVPDVRTSIHLHGGRSHPASDGHPNAWITPEGAARERGPQFARDPHLSEVYEYTNQQRAAMLHYHDHAAGATRLNVHAGLSALYVIRDDYEDSLIAAGLPSGPYEIPLVLQDKILNDQGPAFFYPSEYEGEEHGKGGKYLPLPVPSLVPEFFGDVAVVNGKAWPYLEVEPRLYRFRFQNGSSSRFYRLNLLESDAQGETNGKRVDGPRLVQVGSDGGFLGRAVIFDGRTMKLLLAPAERADVLVDFSADAGKHFVLWNDAVAPFPGGEPDSVLTPLMLFRVRNTTRVPPPALPRLEPISRISEDDAVLRDLLLAEDLDEYGRMRQLLGTLAEGPKFFHDPVTETPLRGGAEIWRLINSSEDTHPIHLHLVQFQVKSRQPIDVERLPALVFTGPPEAPEENEQGWKDVVQARPGYATSIIARFDAPESWVYEGAEYLWHCHMLEHEDHDMMRPFRLK